MGKTTLRFTDLIFWLTLVGADLFIYIVFGVLQMDYEDHWDQTKGAFGSFSSMNTWQLTFYVALQLWNVINFIGLLFMVRRLYNRMKGVDECKRIPD